jgi:hypothetical protein
MPLFKLKRVWEYCSYNIPFFVFILILIFIINSISNISYDGFGSDIGFAVEIIISVILTGYGLSITRDRINHGYRLPKIMPKDVIYFGIKGSLVYIIYLSFQVMILTLISDILGFPLFDLKELILSFTGTFHMLLEHDPIHSIVFLVLGGIVFYVTSFFAEIGLAKLADTKSIISSFDLKSIYRDIESFGWRRYARDLTSIILAIVILTYVKSNLSPFFWIDNVLGTVLGFLIFATQYLGIGAVYCNMKDMKEKSDK